MVTGGLRYFDTFHPYRPILLARWQVRALEAARDNDPCDADHTGLDACRFCDWKAAA
jgi:hypothetical protein